MKLFLCSHFSSVGSLIKEEIENKKVAFIPTASLREGYTGYVGSARKLFKKLGAIVTEIDISTEAYSTIQSVFEDADVIYFTGGNSFFLIDQLRKTGTDELLKKELAKGKLMIGESAGAIICAPSIQYIEQMDEKPEDYSQEDDAGLDLIDFYVLPHYLTAPFKKVTEKIMTEFSDLNLCPINNRQGIVIDGEGSKVICKDQVVLFVLLALCGMVWYTRLGSINRNLSGQSPSILLRKTVLSLKSPTGAFIAPLRCANANFALHNAC